MKLQMVDDKYINESDVEQKFVLQLLTEKEPNGLGYEFSDIRTKPDLRKLAIDKGSKSKLYYPDYALIIDGVPCVIVEVKKPGSDLIEAMREARLYAMEVNSLYRVNINPCRVIVATDGVSLFASSWDQAEPELNISVGNISPLSVDMGKLVDFASRKKMVIWCSEILTDIRKKAKYFRPVSMLGGKAVINESVGENSFGANVSVEYNHLFNPESAEDRRSLIENAYIGSKRKQSHVSPIDRLIRASLPKSMLNARQIQDTEKPSDISDKLKNINQVRNEVLILIGSVGSGKSTFTDYLRFQALPPSLRSSTEWIYLNLNKAPLSRDLIYGWVLEKSIESIKSLHKDIDFDSLDVIRCVFSRELSAFEKGRFSLLEESQKSSELYLKIGQLEADKKVVLQGLINYLYTGSEKLLVIVLDNCDKGNRDDQLLMFEVSSWLKDNFSCAIFLPLRDTTYDQFCDESPLDTVIKDMVFRIDPPPLDKVIQARLDYALRVIDASNEPFSYNLPNSVSVSCKRNEVGLYLKSIVQSLFQDYHFKRVITGLAGRNVRKGLEMLLDFCKSGHLSESEIFKIRQSSGVYQLPHHIVSKIILKGNRRYYSDEHSNIKNLFNALIDDPLPDPFARISILNWLRDRFREYGPSRVKGFHKLSSAIFDLQSFGHSGDTVVSEVESLVAAGCIISESQGNDISVDDLICISPAGFTHIDLLNDISYLSVVAEDCLFRENQPARKIADNLVGHGEFKAETLQSSLSTSHELMAYLNRYQQDFFIGQAKILGDSVRHENLGIDDIYQFVKMKMANEPAFQDKDFFEEKYPSGSKVEAEIVSIQPYGVFVEFGLDGVGLIHKSELRINGREISDVYDEGDRVNAEIILYNMEHKRFNLRISTR